MTLIERLLAQANKESNGLADLLNEAAQALAQPKQEPQPVAIAECKEVHGHTSQFLKRTRYGMDTLKDGDKLYTYPPAQQSPWCMKMDGCKTKCEDCPDEAPKQEPVGEVTDALGDAFKCEFKGPLSVGTKLYTSPPARKPLTDEEIYMHCPIWLSQEQCKTWVRQIEAAHGIKESQ